MEKNENYNVNELWCIENIHRKLMAKGKNPLLNQLSEFIFGLVISKAR